MTKRYQALFNRLNTENQGAFVPFVTIGDPNRELSIKIIDTLVKAGADALELGIPFSDPVADGTVIQDASTRALDAGITPDKSLEIIKEIRKLHPTVPIGLLLYVNIVYRNGIEDFYQRCADAGVDSILIADVPIEESAPFREAATKTGLQQIFIAPPNGDVETLQQVAEYGEGYTYLLSRAGVTGADAKAGMPVEHMLETLKKHNAPPSLLGFGISKPAQVKEAIKSGAAGAISGSAVVKVIQANLDDPDKLLQEMEKFIGKMKAATYL
ncbi:tryptophan synthase subunit alpha [Psychromonas sp. psych-6C06]|uniref:tryptophan synthase subunit alpha n=1 Tax=Psychromonas sp. psych-6C06 TaxID=2058089 RepID=UPI000C330E99|nr:tryptophan synthase subunit alpha [Psychromonas sp. psych-6C06]PKF62623.1 tryptophan synthase subunit alpha [Psychromonas sp. psych-6C06]